MVHQLNSAIAPIGDRGPFLSDHVHGAVVVFAGFVTADERVDHNDVDFSGSNFGEQSVDNWPDDNRAVSSCRGNHKPLFAATVDE